MGAGDESNSLVTTRPGDLHTITMSLRNDENAGSPGRTGKGQADALNTGSPGPVLSLSILFALGLWKKKLNTIVNDTEPV